MSVRRRQSAHRRGACAVEFAVLLPVLVLLIVIAVDFARFFYFSLTVANCARNGAIYESDQYGKAESPYQNLQEAVLADAPNINDPGNPLVINSSSGTDSTGESYIEVSVRYRFDMITRFPGVPSNFMLDRTVRMAQAPANPPTN